MLTLKLTDEQMAAMDAKSVEDVMAVIQSAQATAAELAEVKKAKAAMEAEHETLKAQVAALAAKIEAIGKPVDVAAMRAEILAEANKSMCAYVSKLGAQALPSGEVPPDVSAGDKKQIAADDYKGQWEASEDLRAEFVSFESYAAFKRASDDGRVRVCKQTN